MSDRQLPRRYPSCPCGSGLDSYVLHHPRTGRVVLTCCALCGVEVGAYLKQHAEYCPNEDPDQKQFLKRV